MTNHFIYTGQSLAIDGKSITTGAHVKTLEKSVSGITALVETIYTHGGLRFQCLASELKPFIFSEKTPIEFDYSKISNVMVEGIDMEDYGDFCDASITSADYDGVPMTDEQIEELNNDSEFVNQSVFAQIY